MKVKTNKQKKQQHILTFIDTYINLKTAHSLQIPQIEKFPFSAVFLMFLPSISCIIPSISHVSPVLYQDAIMYTDKQDIQMYKMFLASQHNCVMSLPMCQLD